MKKTYHSFYNILFSKELSVISLFQIICFCALSQLPPENFTYQNSTDLLNNFKANEISNQRLASRLDFIGLDSLSFVNFPVGLNKVDLPKNLSNYKPVDAKDYILDVIQDQRVVFLNEAHHISNGRVFTKNLLCDLRKKGFTHFGMESLYFNNGTYYPSKYPYCMDTLLLLNGCPVIGNHSGTYLKNPNMSNLLRESIRLGFQFFAYDDMRKGREERGAKNILNVLQENTKNKVIIFCGFAHAMEYNDGKKWLAQILKDSLNEDVITIDQTQLNGYNKASQLIYDFYNILSHQPVALINRFDNLPFSCYKTDISVIHPPVSYTKYGRPEWLMNSKGLYSSVLSNAYNLKAGQKYILKVNRNNDPTGAIPVDIIEICQKDKKFELFTPHGFYRLSLCLNGECNSAGYLNVDAAKGCQRFE